MNHLNRAEIEEYLYKVSTKNLLKSVKGQTINSVIYFDQDHKC